MMMMMTQKSNSVIPNSVLQAILTLLKIDIKHNILMEMRLIKT